MVAWKKGNHYYNKRCLQNGYWYGLAQKEKLEQRQIFLLETIINPKFSIQLWSFKFHWLNFKPSFNEGLLWTSGLLNSGCKWTYDSFPMLPRVKWYHWWHQKCFMKRTAFCCCCQFLSFFCRSGGGFWHYLHDLCQDNFAIYY